MYDAHHPEVGEETLTADARAIVMMMLIIMVTAMIVVVYADAVARVMVMC